MEYFEDEFKKAKETLALFEEDEILKAKFEKYIMQLEETFEEFRELCVEVYELEEEGDLFQTFYSTLREHQQIYLEVGLLVGKKLGREEK